MLFYEGYVDGGCDNFQYQPFLFFNDNTKVTKDTLVNNNSEIIMKLMFSNSKVNGVDGLGIDSDNTKLIVFTVINTNDNENIPHTIEYAKVTPGKFDNTIKKISNNPPNPPYINTNILKKFYNESKYLQMISEYLTTIPDTSLFSEYETVFNAYMSRYNALNNTFSQRINKYDFYKVDKTFQLLIKDGIMIPNYLKYADVEKIIQYIEINNETTLIGTLNFMNFMNILNPNGMKPICATDQMIEHEPNSLNRTTYVDTSKI